MADELRESIKKLVRYEIARHVGRWGDDDCVALAADAVFSIVAEAARDAALEDAAAWLRDYAGKHSGEATSFEPNLSLNLAADAIERGEHTSQTDDR